MKPLFLIAALCGLATASAQEKPGIFSGIYDNGQFQSLTFVNSLSGWDTFFNAGYLGDNRVIANVEAGLIWSGHEVFDRPAGVADAVALTLAGPGALAEVDFHATMVGHMLAGTGYVAGTNPPQFTLVGVGMAPHAKLWSGAVATSYAPAAVGEFGTGATAAIGVYRPFFQGIGGVKPDVVNSSWGGLGPAANDPTSLAIDGLARENPTVAFVAAAGNDASASVSAPGSVYNGITVGSLGGTGFRTPSAFTSRGLASFHNPVTNMTTQNARVAVDLAAPGESLVLAAYLGGTGSVGASTDPSIQDLVQPVPATDLYFLNQDGTSFAAPVVSGAIALLRQVADEHPLLNFAGTPSAKDARVIKSVLMAGAERTVGWDNGLASDGVVMRTTQGLDAATGAGALALDRTVEIYFLAETRDLSGSGGGSITAKGWDFGSVALAGSNDYTFANPFSEPVELTLSLNWFAGRTFDDGTNLGEAIHFSDLNLQLWTVSGGLFTSLVASSETLYNNSEFLRLMVPAGQYGVRVEFESALYGSPGPGGEEYALAWQAIPEPSALFLALCGLVLLVLVARRRA